LDTASIIVIHRNPGSELQKPRRLIGLSKIILYKCDCKTT